MRQFHNESSGIVDVDTQTDNLDEISADMCLVKILQSSLTGIAASNFKDRGKIFPVQEKTVTH